MSQSLYWKPYSPTGNYVGSLELKQILCRRFTLPVRLTVLDLQYLEGLNDANINCVSELIEAIKNNQVIELYLEG